MKVTVETVDGVRTVRVKGDTYSLETLASLAAATAADGQPRHTWQGRKGKPELTVSFERIPAGGEEA